MQELLERVLAFLSLAGVRAQQALPSKLTAQLKAPITAVGVGRVAHTPVGLGGYLGSQEDLQSGTRDAYGAMLEAELYFKIASPVHLGGGRCFQEALALLDVLLGGMGGLDISQCTMDQCQYEAKADRFSCTVTASVRAAVYLNQLQGSQEVFGDFQLKGEVR